MTGWMAEVKAERIAAEQAIGETAHRVRASERRRGPHALVGAVRDGLIGLTRAPARAQKQAMYVTMGLRLTYHPEHR